MINDNLKLAVSSAYLHDHISTNVKITTPNLTQDRPNMAIICVLDISGSMDSEATQGQSTQSDGFSRLDLVKHSVNTVIHSLSAGDILGVVTFSDHARVDFKLAHMDEHGKTNALNMIKNMKTEGSTNLWDGIKHGLELSRSHLCDDKNTFVLVLSDGEPNVHPQEGQLQAVQNYLKQFPLKCNLSMFGYGYNLDTKLLSSITQLGGGCYGYIPDCSMVGTIFVNFLSHSLASFSSLIQVEIVQKAGQLVALNGQKHKKCLLGSSQFGYTRNVLVQFKDVHDGTQYAELVVRYGKNLRKEERMTLKAEKCGQQSQVKVQDLRYQYINMLKTSSEKANANNLVDASSYFKHLIAKMTKINSELKDQYLSALIRDIQSPNDNEGQVGKSVTNQEWWKKWGLHYLPALRIAHTIEMCTNFKDPGIQKYASELFRSNQSKIDTIFIKLPPPQPTIKKYDPQGNVQQVNNMANYYNYGGGCIYGECLAQTKTGVKRVCELKQGDIIKTKHGQATIKCVLITDVNSQIQMVKFPSGLIITNYHPIFYKGAWSFPCDIFQAETIYVDKYYNFVLEQHHAMIINGIACITLGHGMKGNNVVEHEYLGTQKILNDLQKLRGWNIGQVVIQKDMMKRDPFTNLIIGLAV